MTRIGGMAQDTPDGWFDDVLEFCKELAEGVDELEGLLTDNKIWQQRTQGVGASSLKKPSCGDTQGRVFVLQVLDLDLRKADPYYGYETLDFDVPVGTTGDCYDRYLVRVAEMRESIKIIRQVCKNVPGGDYTIRDKEHRSSRKARRLWEHRRFNEPFHVGDERLKSTCW